MLRVWYPGIMWLCRILPVVPSGIGSALNPWASGKLSSFLGQPTFAMGCSQLVFGAMVALLGAVWEGEGCWQGILGQPTAGVNGACTHGSHDALVLICCSWQVHQKQLTAANSAKSSEAPSCILGLTHKQKEDIEICRYAAI